MTRILFDKVLREKLFDLRQAVELYDEGGKVVGRVIPAVETTMRSKEPPPLTEEELRRIEEEEPDYSLAEVLARLEKL